MAPKLKELSGDEVIAIFERFGFRVHNQKGSHIKMRRIVGGVKETLLIPNHHVIAKGTVRAIFNQASAYLSQTDLHPFFYHSDR